MQHEKHTTQTVFMANSGELTENQHTFSY